MNYISSIVLKGNPTQSKLFENKLTKLNLKTSKEIKNYLTFCHKLIHIHSSFS